MNQKSLLFPQTDISKYPNQSHICQQISRNANTRGKNIEGTDKRNVGFVFWKLIHIVIELKLWQHECIWNILDAATITADGVIEVLIWCGVPSFLMTMQPICKQAKTKHEAAFSPGGSQATQQDTRMISINRFAWFS